MSTRKGGPAFLQSLLRRIEGRFWGRTLGLRRHLRTLRQRASSLRYAWRARRARRQGGDLPPRVIYGPLAAPESLAAPEPLAAGGPPRIGAEPDFLAQLASNGGAGLELAELLEDAGGEGTELVFGVEGDVSLLPPTVLESLLLVMASEPVPLALAGGGPAATAAGPQGPPVPFTAPSSGGEGEARAFLLRAPAAGDPAPGIAGRWVHHVADPVDLDGLDFGLPTAGWHLLGPGIAPGQELRQPVFDVDQALRWIPPSQDPRPAALFLLPFLAVGGAERLLFDLLEGLGRRYRLLVATLDPHQARLGQTVGRARALGARVYTLGDWLPRTARMPALRHLLRRHRVSTLVSWNGTVDFFDSISELRRHHPELRILSQLYHHRGGWTARTSPEVVEAVDLHLAVNGPIARALVEERGVPRERVALVHHGVPIPELPDPGGPGDARRQELRRALREQLGLPGDAVVVGSFIRLHAQKRPLDIVALAQRFAAENVVFLLVGGGPMEAEVEAAIENVIEREPGRGPNLVRHPMVSDALPFYDAIDLCLMTSEYEGLPVFLLDGLARGLPAVAPAVGDIPLILGPPSPEGASGPEDGFGGIAVGSPGDLDGLEQAVRAFLDPGARRRAGERGRRLVAEKFGVEAYCRRYEGLIFPETRQ